MSSELRPCPACGYIKYIIHDYSVRNEHFIQCGRCRMCGPICKTEKMAFNAWDALPRREDAAELVKVLQEYEKLEGDVIMNSDWILDCPLFNQYQTDEWIRIQRQARAALEQWGK